MRADGTNGSARRALLPPSDIPLLYFGFAHICFAAALAVLVARPDLPGGFFHHPRMMERENMRPVPRSAHSLASHGLAKAILTTWTLGVPLLIAGLAVDIDPVIAAGSALLLAGVALNAAQAVTIVTADAADSR